MTLGICAQVMYSGGHMPMVVVYRQPKDYPDKFVARLWNISGNGAMATQVIIVKDSLPEIRKEIPDGFIRIMPDTLDDPAIVEVWV